MTQFHNIESYNELKMRLDLLGVDYPPEYLFDFAMSAKRNMEKHGMSAASWSRFCEAIQWRIDNGVSLSNMNSLNTGLM